MSKAQRQSSNTNDACSDINLLQQSLSKITSIYPISDMITKLKRDQTVSNEELKSVAACKSGVLKPIAIFCEEALKQRVAEAKVKQANTKTPKAGSLVNVLKYSNQIKHMPPANFASSDEDNESLDNCSISSKVTSVTSKDTTKRSKKESPKMICRSSEDEESLPTIQKYNTHVKPNNKTPLYPNVRHHTNNDIQSDEEEV